MKYFAFFAQSGLAPEWEGNIETLKLIPLKPGLARTTNKQLYVRSSRVVGASRVLKIADSKGWVGTWGLEEGGVIFGVKRTEQFSVIATKTGILICKCIHHC